MALPSSPIPPPRAPEHLRLKTLEPVERAAWVEMKRHTLAAEAAHNLVRNIHFELGTGPIIDPEVELQFYLLLLGKLRELPGPQV